MKYILLFSVFLYSTILSAQKETFDVTTYIPPKSWKKQAVGSAIQFKKEDAAKGTYCLITLYKAVPGVASSKENFDLAWESLIEEMVTVSAAPEMQAVTTENGWETQTGYAGFEKDGSKGIALLVTASSFEKMVNLVMLTNTDVYEKNITDFLASISIKKQESKKITGNNDKGSVAPSQLVQFTWKQTSNNNGGYSTNTYEFRSNNTYKFSRVDFQLYTPKFYLEDEEGTYKVNGNKITLVPSKGKFHVHKSKVTDPVLKSGNLSLQSTPYSFEITIINDKQALLLTPVDGKETRRDGVFSFWLNGQKTRSYFFYGSTVTTKETLPVSGGTKETVQPKTGKGFAFTTSNFDDGWVATEQPDWVQVIKGNTRVLIHYPQKIVDDYNPDLLASLKNAWDILVAPRYSSASNMEFKPIHNWQSIEFAEADMVERSTGKSVHVVFFKKNDERGKYTEFITKDKRSFEQEFGAYQQSSSGWEKMENMVNYNKFAVAASDLQGKWTNKFTGVLQYVNAYTGLSAGMDTHASTENFQFTGASYKWDVVVASGPVGNIKFQSVKSNGKLTMINNWQVKFSDIEGKPRTYDAYFSCIKGLRLLWLDNEPFAKVE